MEKIESGANRFGLIGKDISYSFSKGYFGEKFSHLELSDYSYENFDLKTIEEFDSLLHNNPDLKGLNVTIPYKEKVQAYLSGIDDIAAQIGAVNTIKFTKKGLVGYNTDIYGFQKSIEPFLEKHHQKALILGTGGASKAIAFVLGSLQIPYTFASRKPQENQLSYEDLTEEIIKEHQVIVNCTPLGTYPNIDEKPKLPYQHINTKHLLFDLIYNPEKTAFLKEGEIQGAAICNGLRMLELQAEKAWEIWNDT